MVRCARYGSGFSPVHSATEVSCPRCRLSDGVISDFITVTPTGSRPVFKESLNEMTRRLERGRARIGVNQASTGA